MASAGQYIFTTSNHIRIFGKHVNEFTKGICYIDQFHSFIMEAKFDARRFLIEGQ